MALDWIPIAPGQVPHRRTRLLSEAIAPFTAVTIPVPLIAGRLAFLPAFPDQVPHHRSPAARLMASYPVFTAATAPIDWTPTAPTRTMATRNRSVASWPSVFAPPPGELVNIARRMSWSPRYPSTTVHTRPPNEGGSFAAINPRVAAAGVQCVAWVDGDLTASGVVDEALTTSGVGTEALGTPALIQEDLC